MTYQYAAYGSNLHPIRLRRRVPSAAHIGTGFITPWNLRFHKRSSKDGTGKCSIARGGAGVFLAIFEIDSAEKQKLDGVEGLGYGYNEITISVPDYGDCLTYVADEGATDEALHPVDWYREMVIVGCEKPIRPCIAPKRDVAAFLIFAATICWKRRYKIGATQGLTMV